MPNNPRDERTIRGAGPEGDGRRHAAHLRPRSVLSLVAIVALILGGASGLVSWLGSPEPVIGATGGSYGSGIGADSLSNVQVGGTLCRCSNSSTSYRFRATQTSALKSIMIYIVANGNSGYSHGSGGTLSASVETDGGGSAHAPSGHVLATASVRPGNPGPAFLKIGFASPARLVAGQIYHIVFRNTDSSPTVNYISVDDLWTRTATTPRQPGLSDLSWAQLENDGRGWSTLRDYTPILDLGYANGVHAGQGYMEVWVNSPKAISGSSAVREVFAPRSSVTVSSVQVRVSQTGGSSPLIVRLATSGGSVLASGSIGAASIGSTTTWFTARLSKSVELRARSTYQLILSTSPGTSYSAFAIERGNNYNFPASEYFTDGHAEFTTGSGWRGFTDESGRTATNSDLQFLFHSTGSVPRASKPATKPPVRTGRGATPTARPAAAASPSPAPSGTGSPAPSIALVTVSPTSAALGLVPLPASTAGPDPATAPVATRSGSDPGATLPMVGLALIVLGGLGVALRRRVKL